MKKYIIATAVISIITGFTIAYAEEKTTPLSIDAFIKTAETDLKLQNQKELTSYIQDAPTSTPYIDRMEFRTKTEEFDLSKQKYSLRFYPKGWGETRHTREVSELINSSSQTEEMNCYNDAVKMRYDLVLEYIETGTLINLKTKLAAVCEDRIHVLRKKSAGSLSFDISDLISAEETLTELKLELVTLENRLTGLDQRIKAAAGSQAPVAFDRESIIRVSTIQEIVRTLTPESTENNIKMQNQKIKVDLANSKYKLEQAKNRDFLSFVQMSYDCDDNDTAREAYSVELAIKMPFIHSDRDQVNWKKMNYMEQRLKYNEERKALAEKRASLSRSLDRLIKQHSLLSANKKNSNAEVSFRAYLKMEGMDPLNLLKIRESIIKSDIQRVKTGFNIRYKYIQLMDMAGKLSEKPFKNHIAL